uniref:C2H2-type domain-containing protein n=1 Tax=Ascaris lumbricoides TaxID=6252 RepID=A0A0M3HS35_ASCLU
MTVLLSVVRRVRTDTSTDSAAHNAVWHSVASSDLPATRCKSGLSLPSTSCGNCDAGDLNEDECAETDDSKYNDPLRPFKCDLCRESFTQKQLLLAHYNSLNHLHRAKKILEQQPNNFHLSVQMLAALELPTSQQLAGGSQSYSSTSKPFKCNICKLGYGQGSTLDIHVRSVAHQSRLSKIAELVAQGELDPTKPLLEQPGSAPQKTIAELLPKGDVEQVNFYMTYCITVEESSRCMRLSLDCLQKVMKVMCSWDHLVVTQRSSLLGAYQDL